MQKNLQWDNWNKIYKIYKLGKEKILINIKDTCCWEDGAIYAYISLYLNCGLSTKVPSKLKSRWKWGFLIVENQSKFNKSCSFFKFIEEIFFQIMFEDIKIFSML